MHMRATLRRSCVLLALVVALAWQAASGRTQEQCAIQERCSTEPGCYLKLGTSMPAVRSPHPGESDVWHMGNSNCGWTWCYLIFVCDCGNKFADGLCLMGDPI